MKKFLLILVPAILLFFFTPGNANCQSADSCLKMYIPNEPWNGYHNADSVMVDTCQYSNTWGEWYVKKGIYFFCHNYIFTPKPLHKDSQVSWDSIDSAYKNMRDTFALMEKRFGKYTISRPPAKYYPIYDSTTPVFNINFENYNCWDTLSNFLKNISEIPKIGLNDKPSFDDMFEKNLLTFKLKNIDNKELIVNSEYFLNQLYLKIEIYNLLGTLVYSKNYIHDNSDIIIDISNFINGEYLIRINNVTELIIIFR